MLVKLTNCVDKTAIFGERAFCKNQKLFQIMLLLEANPVYENWS